MLKIVPTPEFVKQVKKLAKSYNKIATDLELLKEELLLNPRLGTELGNKCFKIRLANSSIPTGKSGGFRVITYYLDHQGVIRLLLIYTKTQKENISDKELSEVLRKLNENSL
ncbi:type II toxin-antitoxin system RelE/ParE family toxin [Sulfurimonas sp.]|uniref:type II toxin-antitoxin system RelE/ParE family toxin n=1 Tax=Sulfurimonas sp. TaxID=2022749 RepID=UPI00262B05DA|nr:type II toxin-antitoxin system RelE/ParE family toxin [Sulfurimonas sp.]